MFPITAISIDTLNVEGTWRFAKDKGKTSVDIVSIVDNHYKFHFETTIFAGAIDFFFMSSAIQLFLSLNRTLFKTSNSLVFHFFDNFYF